MSQAIQMIGRDEKALQSSFFHKDSLRRDAGFDAISA
jgi:hypothetical protein